VEDGSTDTVLVIVSLISWCCNQLSGWCTWIAQVLKPCCNL